MSTGKNELIVVPDRPNTPSESTVKASIVVVALSTLLTGISTSATAWNAFTNSRAYKSDQEKRLRDHEIFDLELLYDAVAIAEQNSCIARSNINGSHQFKMAFALAIELERKHRDSVPVHVYHALADLGDQVLTFEATRMYCEIALEKSSVVNDQSLSYQQLGAAHFRYDGIDGADANLRTARKSFQSAVSVLPQTPHTARQRGLVYELWAAHEMYHDHEKEANEKAALAIACWKPLAEVQRQALEAELLKHIADARAGIEPNSPCRVSASATSDPKVVSVPPLSRDSSLGVKNPDGSVRMKYVTVQTVRITDKNGRDGYFLTPVVLERTFMASEEIPEAHYMKVTEEETSLPSILDKSSQRQGEQTDTLMACGC